MKERILNGAKELLEIVSDPEKLERFEHDGFFEGECFYVRPNKGLCANLRLDLISDDDYEKLMNSFLGSKAKHCSTTFPCDSNMFDFFRDSSNGKLYRNPIRIELIKHIIMEFSK